MLLINLIYFFAIRVFCGNNPVIIRPGFLCQGRLNFQGNENKRDLCLDEGAIRYSDDKNKEYMSANKHSIEGVTSYLIKKNYNNREDIDLPLYQYPVASYETDNSSDFQYVLMDYERRFNGTLDDYNKKYKGTKMDCDRISLGLPLDYISSYNIIGFKKNNVSYKVPVLYNASLRYGSSSVSGLSCLVLSSILKFEFDKLIDLYVDDLNLFNKRYQYYLVLSPRDYQQPAFTYKEAAGSQEFEGRAFLSSLLHYLNNLNKQHKANDDELRQYFDNEKEKFMLEGEQEFVFSHSKPKIYTERCYSVLNELSVFLNDKKFEHCVTTEENINLSMNLNKVLIFDFNFEGKFSIGGIINKFTSLFKKEQVCNDGCVLKDGEILVKGNDNDIIRKGHVNFSDLVFKNSEGKELNIEFEDFKIYKNYNYNHYFIMIETDLLLKKSVHSVSIKKFGVEDKDISDDLE